MAVMGKIRTVFISTTTSGGYEAVPKQYPRTFYLQSLELLASIRWSTTFALLRRPGKSRQLVQLVWGWEVWLDGKESCSSLTSNRFEVYPTQPVTAEVTYGLERLAYIQEVDSLSMTLSGLMALYGEIFTHPEYEHSKYSLRSATKTCSWGILRSLEVEAKRCLDEHLVHPAWHYVPQMLAYL